MFYQKIIFVLIIILINNSFGKIPQYTIIEPLNDSNGDVIDGRRPSLDQQACFIGFGDWNGDGLPDLLLTQSASKKCDRYMNIGTKNNYKFEPYKNFKVWIPASG